MALRILVVEDRAGLVHVLARLLEEPGIELVPAASEADARRLLGSGSPPALVLVDLPLADGDGLDLCRFVQSRWPTRPIVVCTSEASRELHAKAVLAGASAFLARPFDPETLGALVDRLLNRARWRAS